MDQAEPESDIGAGRIWPQLDRLRWCHLIPQPVCSDGCTGAGGSWGGFSRPPGMVTAAHHFQQAALKLGRENAGYVLWKNAGVCLETWRQRLQGGRSAAHCILGESCINSQPNSLHTLAVY